MGAISRATVLLVCVAGCAAASSGEEATGRSSSGADTSATSGTDVTSAGTHGATETGSASNAGSGSSSDGGSDGSGGVQCMTDPGAVPRVDAGALSVGIAPVVTGELYVVHSPLLNVVTQAITLTSNIYVLRGAEVDGRTEVWLFGSGYGDPEGDVEQYRGTKDAARPALEDARDVHAVICNEFGLTSDRVSIRFVVPHFHLDHVNAELLDAMFDQLGYPIAAASALVHENDLLGSTCGAGAMAAPCCGMLPCQAPTDALFGAPYDPPWTEPLLALFEPMTGGECETLRTFDTPSGAWRIVKETPGHAPGSVNLESDGLGYRILGSAANGCQDNGGLRVLKIHGNAVP